MIRPLLILFLLGALQGAVGWIMVLSGLTGDEIYVKPVKLALHFVFALCLIGYAFWFWLGLTIPWRKDCIEQDFEKIELAHFSHPFYSIDLWSTDGWRKTGECCARPGPPSTGNGYLMPCLAANGNGPFWLENKITVHFIHRGLAYLLLVLVIIWTIMSYRPATNSYYIQKFRSLPFI